MRALSAEISVIAHATEDVAKVSHALKNIFPDSVSDKIKLTTQHLEGHHGNPIKILKTSLTKRKMIDPFLNHLLKNLDRKDLSEVVEDLDAQMDDEGNLYIRLDKQAAYMGELRTRQEDPIRIKVKLVGELGRGKPSIDSIRELIEGHEEIR
jgi:hypothetical protein